jgi:hypothetical protein
MVEHTDEDGATVFRHACTLGLEGIVSKRLTTPYRSILARHACPPRRLTVRSLKGHDRPLALQKTTPP